MTIDELLDQEKHALFGSPEFGGLSRQAASEAVDAVSQNLVKPFEMDTLRRSAMFGGSVGVSLASLIGLARLLRHNAAPPKNTYTLSPTIRIYEPARPAPKRRAVKAVPKTASWPVELIGMGSDPTSKLVSHDPSMMTKSILALAAGVPAGFWLANKFNRSLASVARQRELQAAREDFENALRESAEVPAAGNGRKIAMDPDIVKLAENCKQLAEHAYEYKLANGIGDYIPKSIQPIAFAAMTSLPLIGGYFGFKNRWDRRKTPALEYAERKANIDREATNPTYPTAVLEPRHETDDPDEAERYRQLQEELDAALAGSDFPYLS